MTYIEQQGAALRAIADAVANAKHPLPPGGVRTRVKFVTALYSGSVIFEVPGTQEDDPHIKLPVEILPPGIMNMNSGDQFYLDITPCLAFDGHPAAPSTDGESTQR